LLPGGNRSACGSLKEPAVEKKLMRKLCNSLLAGELGMASFDNLSDGFPDTSLFRCRVLRESVVFVYPWSVPGFQKGWPD
jgi:hypothetical protein